MVIFITSLLVSVQAQQIEAQQNPIVVEAVAQGVTQPLRNLRNIPAQPGQPREVPLLRRSLQEVPGDSTDTVVQSLPGDLLLPRPIQNFEGLSSDDNATAHGFRVVPPDTEGDVGPEHYVQYINMIFAIYDKSGNMLAGPFGNYVMWQSLLQDLPPGVEANGDPIVLYDHMADRWMMSEFAFPPSGYPSYQLIAVSQTPDPTGAWYLYAFRISDTMINDYPKFGVWPDGYYASFNMFTPPSSYAGVVVAVFERRRMLSGQSARMVYFPPLDPDWYYSMLPSDLDGRRPPPGAPNYFAQMEPDEWGFPQDQLGIFEFDVDWSNPGSSTFTPIGSLPTVAFDSTLCSYSRNCIPQKDTGDGLDAISSRLMYRLQYRNFRRQGYQSMVTNHTVSVGGRAGIRWYELRDEGNGWYIHQQGTYAPGRLHRWMGSIAMDKRGNIALGYSASNSSKFPSIRYTGRRASDPPGTMRREKILFAGTGSQFGSYYRWGDYSMMAVDPTDDRTFWYTQEYYATTSAFNWKTRIGSFKIRGGPAPPAPIDTNGFGTEMGTALDTAPVDFTLHQNYPNPFNPETWFPYDLAADANVTITIYNVQGKIVRQLNIGKQATGSYVTKSKSAYWDGKDVRGEKVASGIYWYTLRAGEFLATRRMMILK